MSMSDRYRIGPSLVLVELVAPGDVGGVTSGRVENEVVGVVTPCGTGVVAPPVVGFCCRFTAAAVATAALASAADDTTAMVVLAFVAACCDPAAGSC